jgi:hypothetical protein
MQGQFPKDGALTLRPFAVALALGACLVGQSLAKDAPSPMLELATPVQRAPTKVIPDVWVMKGAMGVMPAMLTMEKPVLTTESFAALRAIPCVTDASARRFDNVIALRGKDGNAFGAQVWVVDPAGIGARGWRLNAPATAPGALYLSADWARKLGLPAKPLAGQTIERIAYTSVLTDPTGKPLVPAATKEELIDTPTGQVRSLKLPYGGTFEADRTLLSTEPSQLVLRFEPLFRPKDQPWTNAQLVTQQANSGTVVYLRTKPGLKGAARESCRAQLAKHMQIWSSGLAQTKWTLEQLQD